MTPTYNRRHILTSISYMISHVPRILPLPSELFFLFFECLTTPFAIHARMRAVLSRGNRKRVFCARGLCRAQRPAVLGRVRAAQARRARDRTAGGEHAAGTSVAAGQAALPTRTARGDALARRRVSFVASMVPLRRVLLLLVAVGSARRPPAPTVHVAFIAQDGVKGADGPEGHVAPPLRNTTVCETRATVLHTARHPLQPRANTALAAEHLDIDDDAHTRPAFEVRRRQRPARRRPCRCSARATGTSARWRMPPPATCATGWR